MASETLDQVLFFYTETSLHAGTGSSVSAVDLPIQRERATGYPLVQGSGVKGALRMQAQLSNEETALIFGPDPDALRGDNNKNAHAGAVAVGDARIVLFPVRSLSGVFAYTTSSLALSRLTRLIALPAIPVAPAAETAWITTKSDLEQRGRVVLEEFSFHAQPSSELDQVANWLANHAFPEGYAYWREKVQRSLIMLPDDDFRDFVMHSTEITTHVKLNKATKTADKDQGALWTQESIPSDALFAVPVVARESQNGNAHSAKQVATLINRAYPNRRIQLGGDETTGQGMIALRWSNGGEA